MNSTILTQPLSGDERFIDGTSTLPPTVKDFWAWAMSRLLGDGTRGDLAEYVVRMALGADVITPKKGWGEFDIEYRGKKIEVKCSAYLQAWERDKPSSPVFGIPKTAACDIQMVDGEWRYVGRGPKDTPKRRSYLYVFCLFAETDREKADILNMEQWVFYVVPTSQINERYGDRRSITLAGLARLDAAKCSYSELKQVVDAIIAAECKPLTN